MLRFTFSLFSKSVGVPSNKAKGVEMVLEPQMNSAQRRKLGDITNLQNQNRLMNQEAYQQQQSFAEKLQKALLIPILS